MMSKFDDPILREKARFLGEKGWAIPFQLAPGNVKNLLDEIYLDSDQDIDQMFITFYEDWMLLPRVFTSLKENIHFSKYVTLMSEAIDTYEMKKYAVVVASLISVIEGLLSILTGDTSSSMKNKLDLIDKAANTDFDILTAPVMISLNAFIKPLYSSSDFSSTQPPIVNRHWINHGRAEVESCQKDALKIINAINCIGYTVKYLVK